MKCQVQYQPTAACRLSSRKVMPDHNKPPANDSRPRPGVSERLAQFERRQGELWRLTFFLLLVIAVVFAVVSWDTIRSLAVRFEALPVGLVILVALFGMYTWKRTQEMSELRGLVKGLEQRRPNLPAIASWTSSLP